MVDTRSSGAVAAVLNDEKSAWDSPSNVNSPINLIIRLPEGVNDRLITLQLPLAARTVLR